jgi:hypothetical protein
MADPGYNENGNGFQYVYERNSVGLVNEFHPIAEFFGTLLFDGQIVLREAYKEEPYIAIFDSVKGLDQVVYVLPDLERAGVRKGELGMLRKGELAKQIQINPVAYDSHSIFGQTLPYERICVRLGDGHNIISACHSHPRNNSDS